jgi:hypothetical protein
MDPNKRLTPERGLKHPWIKRSKAESLITDLSNTTVLQWGDDLFSLAKSFDRI